MRMVDIIENVSRTRQLSGRTFHRDPYDRKKQLFAVLDDAGFDTDYDSMDIMLGNESNGDYGFGWDGVTDSELNPLEPKLAMQVQLDRIHAYSAWIEAVNYLVP